MGGIGGYGISSCLPPHQTSLNFCPAPAHPCLIYEDSIPKWPKSSHNETTSVQRLGDGKACVEYVLAFLLSLGFQLKHQATCRGGECLTRHSHDVRVRLGGVTIWRLQCTRCKAVFTILPHVVLRYRFMRPAVARDARLAMHGGLS
jgi:hypothetical protein